MGNESTGQRFEKLIEIMATLRGPNGCPWDKEQDFNTLKPMLVEEVYEVLEAVDLQDFEGVAEELGDLLLHIAFNAQLGKEAGLFDINTVLQKICDKLIRRHPHVFGTEASGTAEEVLKNWEVIKAQEKAEKRNDNGVERPSILDGIPSTLPALHEAHKISTRARRVGFDWPDIEGVFDKLQEEVLELREVIAESSPAPERLEDELGDILFTIVNVARVLNVDSESALKRANRKFKSRFQHMERELVRQGKTFEESNMDEMQELWQRAKSEKPNL